MEKIMRWYQSIFVRRHFLCRWRAVIASLYLSLAFTVFGVSVTSCAIVFSVFFGNINEHFVLLKCQRKRSHISDERKVIFIIVSQISITKWKSQRCHRTKITEIKKDKSKAKTIKIGQSELAIPNGNHYNDQSIREINHTLQSSFLLFVLPLFCTSTVSSSRFQFECATWRIIILSLIQLETSKQVAL